IERTMRLTLLSTFLFCMQLSAKVYSQKDIKLSMDVKDVRLSRALDKIQDVTGCRFFYNAKDVPLNRLVSVKTNGSQELTDVLSNLLSSLNLNYRLLSDNVIAITVSRNMPFSLVEGIVTDSKGTPLPGVSIKVKGANTGAATDAFGHYKLDAPADAVLVISYIGFQSQELAVNGKSTLNITLREEAKGLGEVIVVGYGTQKKVSTTAAISTLKGDDIARAPVANINNAIAGRVSGVLAFQGSGEPGVDAAVIRVRGIGTTGGNNGPLTIVDGVPRTYSQINPAEIESVTVLKDAAAIAPYGLAGANGVLLITTKRGKAGKVDMNFNTWYGFQQPTQYPHYLDSYGFATALNAANKNAGLPAAYSDEQLQKYKDHSDPDHYPDHDWMREVIDFAAPMNNQSLSLSGGSDKVRFFSSLGHLYQQGSVDAINYSRYNIASNVDVNATSSTIVSLDIKASLEATKNPGSQSGTGIYTSVTKNPPLLNQQLQFSNGLPGNGLLPSIYGSGYNRVKRNIFFSQLSIEQKIPAIPGLSFKATGAYDKSDSTLKNWQLPYNIYALDANNNFVPTKAGVVAPSLSQGYVQIVNYTLRGYINYNNTFGKHAITALAVAELRQGENNQFGASRLNYQVNLDELSLGSSNKSDLDNWGSSGSYKQLGFVYRLGYTFNQKYMAEFSGRYDGHYYFAPGKRFAFFPAVSLGWRLSEESFIKDNYKWIDNLKLRGSYGKSGNLAGAPFQYLSSYGLTSSYGFGGTQFSQVQGVFERNEPNPNITWETAKKGDIGLEGSFWRGKLNFELDFFKERRSDMLVAPNAVVPVEYGIGISQINAGIMDNKGFDFSVNTAHTFKNGISLNAGLNLSYAKNKLVQTFENASTLNDPNRRRTGRPLDTQFGLKAIGLFQSQEEIDAAPKQTFGPVQPGDIRYADINGDKKIDANDETVIGDPAFPQIIYGITTNVSWKGIDISMLWQGAAKSSFQLTNEASLPFFNGAKIFREQLDYWTPDNRDARYPLIMPAPTSNSQQVSSFWERNGAYLRLKTLELGYTLPAGIMSHLRIHSIRIYGAAQNLLTFSAESYLDPEIGVSSASKRARYYFQQKVFSFGLNANF
ncbi:TonB-dependent receptor, partial [Chitinophaga sp.]|uniref:SusC/RagA family TonB-linked outer membrane protein n=1 Tax=Chitinophaga sp. TaxID=1869181 RepID=UPI002D80F94C